MGLKKLTYAAVTPARDEAANLPRLAKSMAEQTTAPAAWVIVENGSVDETLSIARALAEEHPHVSVLQTSGGEYDRASLYMEAFHAGVASLEGRGDVVVKLDADVSFGPDYFETLLGAFEADHRLGIASGTLFEQKNGRWREQVLLGDHVWGPARAYRRACLEAVLPLDDGLAYSIVDETKASLAGFRTATLRELPFYHHRPEGSRQGSRWNAWRADGLAAHYVGYRFSYLVARTIYRMLTDRAAAGLISGYVAALRQRTPRHPDQVLREAIREQQRIRHLRRRLQASRSDRGVEDTVKALSTS
jgi:poly-beta-1,6-N-acetyl-D-glucosamine synthase